MGMDLIVWFLIGGFWLVYVIRVIFGVDGVKFEFKVGIWGVFIC